MDQTMVIQTLIVAGLLIVVLSSMGVYSVYRRIKEATKIYVYHEYRTMLLTAVQDFDESHGGFAVSVVRWQKTAEFLKGIGLYRIPPLREMFQDVHQEASGQNHSAVRIEWDYELPNLILNPWSYVSLNSEGAEVSAVRGLPRNDLFDYTWRRDFFQRSSAIELLLILAPDGTVRAKVDRSEIMGSSAFQGAG